MQSSSLQSNKRGPSSGDGSFSFGFPKRARTSFNNPQGPQIRPFMNNPISKSQPMQTRPVSSDYYQPPSVWKQQCQPQQPTMYAPNFDSPYFYMGGQSTSQMPSAPQESTPIPRNFSMENARHTPASQVTPRRSVSDPVKSKSLTVLSGTVEKVLNWSKMVRNSPVLYEVMGTIDYVRGGIYPHEKFFSMRDSELGPVLQVVFYEIDRPLPKLQPGSIVKIRGVYKSRSRIHAYDIRACTQEELSVGQHIFYICDRASHDLVSV